MFFVYIEQLKIKSAKNSEMIELWYKKMSPSKMLSLVHTSRHIINFKFGPIKF